MKSSVRPPLLCLALLFVLAPADAGAAARARRPAAHSAKCTGSTPCRACKNCRYCKHCAQEGGKCGVCRRSESTARTWQAAADEQATAAHRH